MAKGPYLTDRIRHMVAEAYRADPQIKPGRAQEELLQRMKAEGLNEIFGPNYPSRSAVSKELKSLRKKDEARPPELKGLDQPWSLSCLAKREYHIPPEAIPVVMFICEDHFRKFKQHLTIRQVLWMARLYKIIDDPLALENFALMYELSEWFDWISGNPTDNRSADLAVIQYMAGRTTRADKKDQLGEFYTYIATHPLLFRSLQAWAREDAKEIERKLEEAQNEKRHEKRNQKAR
jgi:hypothetical protein